ncbi:mannitol operon transcriptional antiterminator [Ligilactobacillus hayakitensis DSM 18933 = JCM 14209]|uniref:Mannitol operon transcriptional antiterminator n=1 Tax=Ligilactobacillus hayakitensis DSM 18933 = JCM 14209 TaxID=1423755 RepID=A0A0R1WRA9_9LACO|nr:HTH domain-containing protein [Ligilactobacillus hayakitensis]KRM19973.1 mannitol operon transcriptional antiterminator [Ligilactobacillus hayakitensis DSM 18933 = JCM 14209]
MLILTERQKNLLILLQKAQGGIGIKQIEERIKVSRRTIYREFKELKKPLQKRGLAIVTIEGKYQIQGQTEDLNELKDDLGEDNPRNEMSVSKRQNALAIKLLFNDEPQKIIALALELHVSEATIQNDLRDVGKAISEYGITLIKKRGVGVYVKGTEITRRQVLCGILLNEINEYRFFNYIENNQYEQEYFLNLIERELLQEIKIDLKKSILQEISLASDHQLMQLILMFAICLMRMQQGQVIKADAKIDDKTLKYQGLVYEFLTNYEKKYPLQVLRQEVLFLAKYVESCDQEASPVFYDDDQELLLSIKIKQFIQQVSNDIRWDFQRNPVFFQKVTKHIGGIIKKKVNQLPNSPIETLTRVSEQYPKLFASISQSWQDNFPTNTLPISELQLLLLYFANELKNRRYQVKVSFLIICENGIGTSSILASRIQKEIPNISNIKVSNVSEVRKLDLSQYDMVLSTIKLPGFPRKYQIVSPLLLDEELGRIKDYLEKSQRKMQENIAVSKENVEKIINHDPIQGLNEIAISSLFCSDLVNGIEVKRLNNKTTLIDEVVDEIVLMVTTSIIRNRTEVAQNLKRRISLAPIGIPDSSIALLHTSSQEIKRCYFTVIDLSCPIRLKAMDQNEIEVTRILVMLGPKNLSEVEQKVMGLISSMIIMSDQSLSLFEKGSKQQIQDVISKRFLQEIKVGIPI